MSGKSVAPTPAPPTPWKPSDLPTLRAAYSDRTAALMAYLAAFAYDTRIQAKGALQVPQELSAFGFNKLTSFHAGDQRETGCCERGHQGAVPIYITGHSLGGALAQIAGAVLGSDQVAACYTFGSPRVGNFYFDLWVKVPSYRVMNYADIVPQVPLPLVYRHSGDPRYMPDRMTPSPYRFEPNLLERGWQMIRGLIQLVRAGSILGIQDHAIAAYCEKLNAIAGARDQSR